VVGARAGLGAAHALAHYLALLVSVQVLLILLVSALTTMAQPVKRLQPVWWFGQSVAANINTYREHLSFINYRSVLLCYCNNDQVHLKILSPHDF